MNRDLDQLASLWRDEADGEDAGDFEQLTERAVRKAQFVQYAEHGLAFLLGAAVLVAVWLAPAPATIAVGAISILALSWSSWKRHLLTEIELLVATSDRPELLDHAATALRAKIWRTQLGLWLFFPGAFLAGLFTHSVVRGGDLAGFTEVVLRGAFESRTGLVLVALVALLLAQLVVKLVRLHRQLAEVEGLHEDYAREARLDIFEASF